MLILDYKTQTIKEVPEKDLNYLAPECFMEVQLSNIDKCYSYRYQLGNKFLDFWFSLEKINQMHVSFQTMELSFLMSHNFVGAKTVKKRIFLTQETIDENLEE